LIRLASFFCTHRIQRRTRFFWIFNFGGAEFLSQLSIQPYGKYHADDAGWRNAVDPTGKFLYVANFASTSISEFDVSGTGDLTGCYHLIGFGRQPILIFFRF